MAKKTNPAVVGAFVIGAVVLTIAAFLIWGSRSVFEHKYEYVCYFPGSVNGLSKGAPVKFRGVELGVVREIRIRYHQAPDDTRVPVLIEAWGKRLRELGGEREPTPAVVQELIARGLRARLETQSIVTGVLYVSLDLVPGSPATLAELPGGAFPEIPTLPTKLEEATKSLSDVVANLKAADFKGMSESISKAALGVSQLSTMPELREALRDLPRVVSSAHRLTLTLNADAEKSGEVVDDVHAAMEDLRGAVKGARGMIAPHSPLSVDVSLTLSDVDKAALAVRELADFLRRNPHALVAGTKPPAEAQ
jgi:paraquat-inducible protein B